MARLPSITSKDQVAAKDRDTFDSIVASRGAVQGPFTMFLHSPEVAGRVADLGAYVRFEGSLDMKVRVLAAMTVAREFEAMYVWGAQTGGARRLGVPEETITAMTGDDIRHFFAHHYRPLQGDELSFVLTRHWRKLGLTLDDADFTDTQAIASITRITGGNFRLLHRLFVQIERILKINGLSVITDDVVEAARSTLVIGIT